MSDLVRILIAPLAWLAAFSAVYGLHGVACGFGWTEPQVFGLALLRFSLVAAWLCSIAALAVVLGGLYSARFASPSPWVRGISRTLGWVGLVATVWTLFPVAVASSCGIV